MHKGLKIPQQQSCAGSIPADGTTKTALYHAIRGFFIVPHVFSSNCFTAFGSCSIFPPHNPQQQSCAGSIPADGTTKTALYHAIRGFFIVPHVFSSNCFTAFGSCSIFPPHKRSRYTIGCTLDSCTAISPFSST